ncbi:MAG: adenylate/guanylate cyclase domain-containing protein [Candidatus Rokuibacteriota bacterium]|nr:MAG: adenylate/guanylate cyclase domain-containing protein [Candidatus Rokubacteria bacterium]
METPETAYARSGDLSIAYQVLGQGPPDLVYISGGFNHIELDWEEEHSARFYRRLASISRLLRFDKRGTGMSDRPVESPSLDTRMDDVRAVLDASESERAFLFVTGDGGFLGTVFAATYPERTAGLILFNSMPRLTRGPDTPWLRTRAELETRLQEVLRQWGNLEAMANLVKDATPSASHEELLDVARRARLSHSPAAVAAYLLPNLDLDVRDVLPSISVPTLIMHRTSDRFPIEQNARYLAEHIASARRVQIPGADVSPSRGDQEALFAEVERFLSESAQEGAHESGPDRVLATILFTDLVDSTARASELGDRRWRELVDEHHRLIRTQLGYFRGREMDTAGDGFFATFDGPARAIRCACAIRDGVRELGLEIRAGLHTGECELMEDKVGGIAVHIGARVASLAQPGEVLVSRTVRDLVAGSGIGLDDRGQHTLKGVAGEWQLYAVTTATESSF